MSSREPPVETPAGSELDDKRVQAPPPPPPPPTPPEPQGTPQLPVIRSPLSDNRSTGRNEPSVASPPPLGPPTDTRPTFKQPTFDGVAKPGLATLTGTNAFQWSEEDDTNLEGMFSLLAPGLPDEVRDNITKMVKESTDPSILDQSIAKFRRQIGLTTVEMFEEAAAVKMLGETPDDEAFALASTDTFLETGGAMRTAAAVFAESAKEKMWFNGTYLEARNIREAINIQAVSEAEAVDSAGRPTTVGSSKYDYGDEINGLRGKRLEWRVSGRELAMRWFTEDPKPGDPDSIDVLIYLDDDTTINTGIDAVTEYLLADDGVKHVVAPSSGDVPGRQTFVGALFEGFDNITQAVERNGGAPLITSIEQIATVILRSQNIIPTPMPGSEQEAADDDALVEQERLVAVTRDFNDFAATTIARQYMFDNPNAPGSNIVMAGFAGAAELDPESTKAAATEYIKELDLAETRRREEQSIMGRFINEDVAPPILDALQKWETGLYFTGVTLLDMSNLDKKKLVDAIGENGVAALLDPNVLQMAAQPLTLDYESVRREFENIREEGLPLAIDAYWESRKDTTFADYYGIDPNSNYAAWVNQVGLIAVDPITWLTVGGNASWNALRKSLTTTAGVERIMKSRPMLSAVKQVVVDDSVGTVTMLAKGNMSSHVIKDLARIGARKYTTYAERVAGMEEAVKIITSDFAASGNGGMYVPSAPAAVLTRKTNLGLAKLAALAPEDTKARGFLQDILVRASQSRSIDLSERGWLADQFRIAEIFRLNDAEGFADDVIRFVDIFDAYRSGDTSIASLEGRAQVLKNEITTLKATPSDIREVPKWRTSVRKFDDQITALDTKIAELEANRGAVEASIPKMRDEIATLRTQLDEAVAAATPTKPNRSQIGYLKQQIRKAERKLDNVGANRDLTSAQTARAQAIEQRDKFHALLNEPAEVGTRTEAFSKRMTEIARRERELRKIKDTVEELGTSGRDRAVLEHATLQYYDEMAGAWGVPVKLNADGTPALHPTFPDLPLRDWDVVVGEGNSSMITEKVSGLAPFGEKYEKDLAAIGMHADMGTAVLPVSPTELLAWNTMKNKWGLDVTAEFFRGHTGLKTTMDNIQAAFATSVLFNMVTMFRSHLDEVVRFFEQYGMSVDLLKTTTPKISAGGRTFGGVGTEAAAWSRDASNTMLAARYQDWRLVNAGESGMWKHAERWINGSLTNDKLFQEWARAVLNGADEVAQRAIWEKFFNKTGSRIATNTTVRGNPVTATSSFDIINDGFELWLNGMKQGKGTIPKSEVKDAILRAAATGQNVTWEQKVWRQLGVVPAQISTDTAGAGKAVRSVVDAGFKYGYGKPQQRRGEVFYDHAFEFVKSTYDDAYAGKIINEEWLLTNGYATSPLHAQELLSAGRRSQVVRDLISDTGMVMEKDIQNAAMKYAESAADDMMYTFGATSIFGKKAARVYPFGRAQVDYMQWWWKKLTQPTQFVGGRQIGTSIPRMVSRVPVVGANIRLIDRMAHLASLGTPGERPGNWTPAGVVNAFSFLPTTIDEQALFDNMPGASPLSGWLVNLPAVPDEVRNVITEFHPTLRKYTEPYSNWEDAIGDIVNILLPKGGLTIRNQAAAVDKLWATATAIWLLGYDPTKPLTADQQRQVTKFTNGAMRRTAGGPWRNDYIKVDQAQWLTENAMSKQPDELDDELLKEWNLRNGVASFASLLEADADFASKVTGNYEPGGSDFAYVDTLLTIDTSVDKWFESGSISRSKRDALMIGWNLVNSGEATVDQRKQFADEVLGTLFNVLTEDERTEFIARNWDVTINLVSSKQVVKELVPADVQQYIVRGKVKTNDLDKYYELYERGDKEGWLEDRDPNDVRFATLLSAHRAFREFYDIIYKNVGWVQVGEDIGEPANTGLTIDKQSVMIDDKRVSINDIDAMLTPEWWAEYGGWIEKTGVFSIPESAKAQLVAGDAVFVPMTVFRQSVVDAKGTFSYSYQDDNTVEAELNRIGIDDRPMSSIGMRLELVDGFNMDDFDQTVGLSFYGKDLRTDFRRALNAGQREFGWRDMTEWENDYIIVQEGKDADGEPNMVRYSLDDLRSRFRTAIALSEMSSGDDKEFSEKNYTNSTYGWNLGELNYEKPQPPPLEDLEYNYYETDTPELLTVIDGDTMKITTDEGPVFVRFLGLNAPERGDEGYRESTHGLREIVLNADKVQVGIYQPDRYGLRTSSFSTVDNAVVSRDRLLVWLYIDGVPLYDPSEFSRENIRGVRTGGDIIDFQALLDAEKTRREVASRERSN